MINYIHSSGNDGSPLFRKEFRSCPLKKLTWFSIRKPPLCLLLTVWALAQNRKSVLQSQSRLFMILDGCFVIETATFLKKSNSLLRKLSAFQAYLIPPIIGISARFTLRKSEILKFPLCRGPLSLMNYFPIWIWLKRWPHTMQCLISRKRFPLPTFI